MTSRYHRWGMMFGHAAMGCAWAMALGCAADPDRPNGIQDPPALPPSPAPQDPLPSASGTFAGKYRVPTNPALANAATFDISNVDWTVVGSQVTLHYNLPAGLVGGHIPITLTGQLDPGSTHVALSGANGRGACVATSVQVTCQEAFAGLGVLPLDPTIVEKSAMANYPGPIADRVAVASVFSSDPIGTIDIDLTKPVIDDHGKGSGGKADL